MKVTVLTRLAKAARQPSQNKSLAEQAVSLIDDGELAADNVKLAAALSDVALSAARKSKDASLLKQAQGCKKTVEEFTQAAEEVQNAKQNTG